MTCTTFHAQVSANGRIIIPADLRKLTNINEGDTIVFTLQNQNTIQIQSIDKAISEAQSLIKDRFSQDDLMNDLKSMRQKDV